LFGFYAKSAFTVEDPALSERELLHVLQVSEPNTEPPALELPSKCSSLRATLLCECLEKLHLCIEEDGTHHRALYWKAKTLCLQHCIINQRDDPDTINLDLQDAEKTMRKLFPNKKGQWISMFHNEQEGIFEKVNISKLKVECLEYKYVQLYLMILEKLGDESTLQGLLKQVKDCKESSPFMHLIREKVLQSLHSVLYAMFRNPSVSVISMEVDDSSICAESISEKVLESTALEKAYDLLLEILDLGYLSKRTYPNLLNSGQLLCRSLLSTEVKQVLSQDKLRTSTLDEKLVMECDDMWPGKNGKKKLGLYSKIT